MPTPYCPEGFDERFFVICHREDATTWTVGPFDLYNEAVDMGAYAPDVTHFTIEKRFLAKELVRDGS